MRSSIYRKVPPKLRRQIEADWFMGGLGLAEIQRKLSARGIEIPRSTIHRHLKMLGRRGHDQVLRMAEAMGAEFARALAPLVKALNLPPGKDS